jgi:hypothetical protein
MAFRIEHRLGVPASAHVIWEVLGDIERWPDWQALYPEVSGTLRIGGRIEVVEKLDGAPPMRLQPTIIDWVPDDQIHWRAKSSGGLITRTRYIEIEKLTDTASIVSNGELYDGFFTRYVSRARRRLIRDGIEAFAEALKAEVLKRA